jgi:hypothetical protein
VLILRPIQGRGDPAAIFRLDELIKLQQILAGRLGWDGAEDRDRLFEPLISVCSPRPAGAQ